ncbi:AraC family transcriptional regulator, partial [Paenibacillus sepulcri]|nr:AraC family transcriptional regulator [Paenibacillus sepulcri]
HTVDLHTETAMVELSYCLQGAREIRVSGAEFEVAPGSYTLQFVNPAKASMHFGGDQAFQMLSIGIPVSTFHHFMEEAGGVRSFEFDRIIGDKPYRMFQQTIDPATIILLRHMLQAARGQAVRNIELECRMLELMSSAFSSFLLDGKPPSTKLSKTDRSKIEHAREIILERMAEPPSLMELSRLIGLNDYKLKTGFKEMYGRTVFGYLRDQRLEKAYRLLRSGSTSVIEVSCEVGYSNPSYFAEAFREKYGVNPGEFVRRS